MQKLKEFMNEEVAFEYSWMTFNKPTRCYKYNKSLKKVQYTDEDIRVIKRVVWKPSTFSLDELMYEVVQAPECWTPIELQ